MLSPESNRSPGNVNRLYEGETPPNLAVATRWGRNASWLAILELEAAAGNPFEL